MFSNDLVRFAKNKSQDLLILSEVTGSIENWFRADLAQLTTARPNLMATTGPYAHLRLVAIRNFPRSDRVCYDLTSIVAVGWAGPARPQTEGIHHGR